MLDLKKVIDHTFLKNEKQEISYIHQKDKIDILVQEAHNLGAYAVCVREELVSDTKDFLQELSSPVKLCSVIGFPCGDDYSTEQKINLLEKARKEGACEFDMVLNVNQLKLGQEQAVYEDILQVSKSAGTDVLKVIFEMALLTLSEKKVALSLCAKAFKDSGFVTGRFFKTSTGFANPPPGIPVGATLEDVKLMFSYAENIFGIKPSGGIDNLEQAHAFFKAVGSPTLPTGAPDPLKFRIGSSTLLLKI
ncbi:MAG: deoxyribose-phosphate aldolase [Bacteriovoracaceae bacterium]|nr:deoxyribose-phosphate aldolase [Bacteriovoracaceae bacterium]